MSDWFGPLKVGDKVFIAQRRSSAEGVVVKIGRKWIVVDDVRYGYRFSVESGRSDTDSYVRAYRNIAHFESDREASVAWAALRHAISYRDPAVTIDAIKQAAALLGVTLPDPPAC